jgi:sugar fermentation stimulation protein A|tara:strand:- start:739 stop:1428 length:690 start_codon:yes stop_codon:yes gene_type:complete
MKFTSSLIKGKLINRYKRFFADIEVNNKTITSHCPNTGSMMGLLDKGNKVWLTKHNDPKRKLKFTLEMIKVKKRTIGVNTHRANRIVEHALENKLITEFNTIKNIKPEFKYSDDTRFDFLCDNKILEVKNVTLLRNANIAEFPDAITSRGSKHLRRLIDSIKKGYKPYVLFLTQIQGINKFRIAKDIDSNYFKDYIEAKKAGVNFLAYRCILSSKEIKIEKKIKIFDEQ